MCFAGYSQQTAQFSHYLFNEYGLNPAYGGTTNCLDARMGYRQQWVGFPNAPQTFFMSVQNTFGKDRFVQKGWHSVGLYAEQDRNEIIKSQQLFLSYAYHLRLTHKWYASAGLFAGLRIESVTAAIAGGNDPALQGLPANLLHYPEFALGGRIYNKHTFLSIGVKQLYKNNLRGGGGQIGTPSKLTPHFNIIAGKKIESSKYYYSYLPSIHIKYGWAMPPAVDASFMFFMKKKLGLGLTYRYNDAIVGMVQYTWKGLTIALAYEYVLSKIRAGASQSREIMLGWSSCPPDALGKDKASCPAYDF